MIVEPKSFRDIVLEQIEKTVGDYRDLVAKSASGWTLSEEQRRHARKCLNHMGLPRWCFERDIAAARSWWATESTYRHRELALLHPHLFCNARDWAERREDDRIRRRQTLADLQAADEES